MGYSTDFIGHIDIRPRLNLAEQRYLLAFDRSRHYHRAEGPYAIPGNPGAEEAGVAIEDYNQPGPGMPGFWCDWSPCWGGDCLAYNGNEKFYDAKRWLEYLIDHFLKPGALASRSGHPYFEEFTFDHELDGIVAACRRDNRELSLIHVVRNKVSEEVVVAGDPRYEDYGLLPYEAEIDRYAERRRQRRAPQA